MSERDDSVEPTEETEDPYAGVPQGKPGGIRLGGSAERVKVQCPTCHGKRTVMHQAFGQEVDAEGNRELIEVTEPCTVCYGTGEITELVLG